MKKETPATTAKRPRQCITPRLRRLIQALLQGPLPRMSADSVVGTTNAPEYVSELKYNYGLAITTEYVTSTDRDGQRTRTGVYHLEPESRGLTESLLKDFKNGGQ